MRVYRRRGAATIAEDAPFTPFLLLADAALVDGTPGLIALEPLHGPGDLRWLARFRAWADARQARDRCERRAGVPPSPAAPYRFFGDEVHQYLLLSGRTSFGDLDAAALRRLALDIEVVTGGGWQFPSAERPGDRIVAVALADSTGFRHVLRGDRMDERALLEACSRLIRARDPDVIEGHNIFRFDLPYLEARARRLGVALAWGRDQSPLRCRPGRLGIGERTVVFPRYQIAGRHVVDTWLLAQLHDVAARDLPSFGLKDVARHLGVAAPDRTYVDPADIARLLRDAPDRLAAYALDDVRETLAIAEVLAAPFIAQARCVPFDYQAVALRGTAAKIDALILREYLHRRHAIPRPGPPRGVGGGHVALLRQGVARPALHVDVASLYPSLMLAGGTRPATDVLGVFPDLLRRLTDFRLRAKRAAREAGAPAARAHLTALQQSFKLLVNSFYGYLASTAAHFNDFEAADRVTADGRAIVRDLIDRLGAAGATVLEADTDGVYFVPPPGHAAAADEALLASLAAGLPGGIALELDGRYPAFFSYKPKTYAFLDEQGRVRLRGSAFRSRGLEPFQRELISELVALLLHGRGRDARAVVHRWLDDFARRRVPVELFARTETLGEPLDVYAARVSRGERHPAAAYEVARASGRRWEPGEQVSYYVAGRGAGVSVTDHARPADAWDPARADENTEYYQAKVRDTWERFRPFAEDDALRPPAAAPAPSLQLDLFP
jgi:DNA polymerase I